jgi:hypothetical protein
MVLMLRSCLLAFFIALCSIAFSQTDSLDYMPRYDYQIYLKQPAKEILELQYDNNCTPINGTFSEDRKKVIMKDYERGNKVYLQIMYEDGTVEEFRRSPCYIDPVIL